MCVVLNFPPAARMLSTVTLTRLDGTPLCSKSFLPGVPGAAWAWIASVVAAELGCAEEEVAAGDDTVTVDGLPCYMVEIIRPACFSARMC